MSKTATKMSWMMVTLLAGALTLPGLALADGRDGHGPDRDHRGYPEWQRVKPRDHWRHHRHDYHDHGGPVVVIRQPPHVRHVPPPPPPPWVPLAVGIAGLLHGH